MVKNTMLKELENAIGDCDNGCFGAVEGIVKEHIGKLQTRLFGYVFDSNIKTLKQAEEETTEAIKQILGEEDDIEYP